MLSLGYNGQNGTRKGVVIAVRRRRLHACIQAAILPGRTQEPVRLCRSFLIAGCRKVLTTTDSALRRRFLFRCRSSGVSLDSFCWLTAGRQRIVLSRLAKRSATFAVIFRLACLSNSRSRGQGLPVPRKRFHYSAMLYRMNFKQSLDKKYDKYIFCDWSKQHYRTKTMFTLILYLQLH